MRNIVIIGNGISGITCARHVRKQSDDHITVISSESDHFFSRTALMYIYMGHMKYEHTKPYEDFFWEKNKITLIKKIVTSIEPKHKKIIMHGNAEIMYDLLIIATGSVTQKFDWPGQELNGVQGLYSLQDIELMEKNTAGIKHAVITGGGLIGVELAEMLHSRKIEVTMLVKDKYYWAGVLQEPDGKLINRHITKHAIAIRYETELQEIIGNENGCVKQVITSKGETLNCGFVGIATGVKPNIDFLKSSGLKIGKGIIINEYFETNINGIYAIGDCAEFENALTGRKKIEQVWYTGRMHGETIAQTICGNRTAYKPGPWFNSAKFFDLEYQTYGLVNAVCNEDEKYFFWQHLTKDIAFGALYNHSTKILIGINCYGMRLKHELFDKWIKEKRTIDFVLSNLDMSLFNSEFSKNYVDEIINEFNSTTKSSVKKNRSMKGFFNFKKTS